MYLWYRQLALRLYGTVSGLLSLWYMQLAPCVSMVPAVGSLCLSGTGSWLPVSLWYRQLALVSMVLSVAPCLYGNDIWLPASLWCRQLAPYVSMVPEVGSMCLYDKGSWLPLSLRYRNLAPCVSMVQAVGSPCL